MEIRRRRYLRFVAYGWWSRTVSSSVNESYDMKCMKVMKHMKKSFFGFFGKSVAGRRSGEMLADQRHGQKGFPKPLVFFMSFIGFTPFMFQDTWSWTPLETTVTSTMRGVSA